MSCHSVQNVTKPNKRDNRIVKKKNEFGCKSQMKVSEKKYIVYTNQQLLYKYFKLKGEHS